MAGPIEHAQKNPIHYGWIILVSGVAVMFACLGIGRFAIGMLLPSMGQSLQLSYSQMGLISTSNFIGYMLSVLFAGFLVRRMGARLAISLGLASVGASMMIINLAEGLWTVLLPYVFTGIGSGLANIPMMGLVAGWFSQKWRGRAAGCMLIGNGLGIVFSGFLVPQMNLRYGSEGWQAAWLVLGMIAMFISCCAWLLLRNDPQQFKLEPLGGGGAKAKRTFAEIKPADLDNSGPPKKTVFLRLGLIYSLFGSSYAVYATFIVTSLVNERRFSEPTAGIFWSVVGGLSLVSGPLAGWISDRFGRSHALVIVFSMLTAAYLFALSALPVIFLYASIAVFGLSLWGVPAIMTATVADLAGPVHAATVFGFITVFFGGGQVVGPAVAGMLAELTGRFDSAFLMCAGLTAAALAISLATGKNDTRARK